MKILSVNQVTVTRANESPLTLANPRLDDPMGPVGGGFGPFGTF